jgi:glutathione S-transferase
VANQAKPWLTGDKPGALDAYALTLVRWAGMVKIDPTQFTALWALANQLVDLPALAPVIERERLQLNLFAA